MDEQQQIVSPIVEILLRKLQSLHKQKVPLGRWGVDNIELEKLETILSSFRAVLLDAEKQQLHNDDVRGWLKKLKDACYDAEDALDELEIEALHNRQLKMDQSRSFARKVCDFISCSSKSFASLRFTIDSSKQIKEIRERLGGIEDDLSKFGFKDRVHHHQDINGNVPKEREIITHSSPVVASDVFERDEVKENIINILLMQKDNDLSSVGGRYGPFGLIDNLDDSVIYIPGPSGNGKTTLAKLVYNDKRIDETFDIKMWVCCRQKYFEKEIIIDMIYSVTGRIENTMEIGQLQQVLQDILKGKKYLLVLDEFDLDWDLLELKSLLPVGAKESKIIAIESYDYFQNDYPLNWLSKESSLSLFMRHAFKEGKEKNPRLREIGKEIAIKCAGRPLLLKILGSILYFSTDEDDWKYVRDNIKQLGVETEGTGKKTEKESISILKLGYDLLPSHLKQCFVCCSVFPFDHGFNNITLIQFWMAHGLLQSDDGNEEPESIGMRYINELRCRCLFQDFEQTFDFITFKMHYLVHLLAQDIAENENLIMDSGKQYNRHISVEYAYKLKKTFFGSKMTRSILYFEMISLSQSFIGSCISTYPNLRVLDFRNSDMEVLPESIGNLKHLRYLNLTKNIKIKRLPKSIFKLRILETLLLGGCKELEELPGDIRHLVNLRMLVFSSKQMHLPENGIGCLTSLRRLGIGSCYNLEYLFEDIGRLKALRTLIIGDCPKLVSLPPGVKDLSSLENLMLSDCENSSKCNLKMEMELQNIKPHLRMLCIDGLPEFNEFPQWLLQCSANTLQWLAIKNCPNLEGLPSEPLQILKSLEVLEISNCPKFSSFPEDMQSLTAMRELKVRGCPDLSKRCNRVTGEDWPKINHIPRIELDGKDDRDSKLGKDIMRLESFIRLLVPLGQVNVRVASSGEVYAFITIFFSDWTELLFIKSYNSLVCTTCPRQVVLANRKRWSGSMAQYNLISSCLRKVQPIFIGIHNLPWIGELLDKYWYSTWEDVNDDLQNIIFRQLLEKSDEIKDDRFTIESCKKLLARRGDSVIEKRYG
ncbi:hypothetical protein EZV62_003281 [Acer yangbiense]|uniref:AAA+ ATPase domain-containing protein n=1 Tax=Acer yangbiense TaxID=1000413 RepID=A0A5C7IIK5_9ROSI|nr:hypothetical protein EZV62_003281 [Acer yangbiense]